MNVLETRWRAQTGLIWPRNRDRQLDVMITVMNLQVAQKPGNIMSSPGTINFQERLCSVELVSYHLVTVPVLLLPPWSQAHLIRAGCCTSFQKWLFRYLPNKGTKAKGAHSSASALICIPVVCGFEYMPQRRLSSQDHDFLSTSR